MDFTPNTTLTQRRNQISTGGSKILTKEKLDHTDDPVTYTDRSAVVKIVVWIVVVVFIGVGAALLLTNLVNSGDQNTATPPAAVTPPAEEPESNPVTPPSNEEEPNEEPEETPPPTTPEPTPTPPVASGDLTQYSTEDRTKTSAATGAHLIFNRFKFFTAATEFNYIFTNVTTVSGAIDPAVKAYYEDNDLVIEFTNMKTDNVTGNGNSTSRTLNGVANITGTRTENRNGVSKYRFLLTKKLPYRVEVKQDTSEIVIQIDNK
jgi:cytoskeletal protein RodZ